MRLRYPGSRTRVEVDRYTKAVNRYIDSMKSKEDTDMSKRIINYGDIKFSDIKKGDRVKVSSKKEPTDYAEFTAVDESIGGSWSSTNYYGAPEFKIEWIERAEPAEPAEPTDEYAVVSFGSYITPFYKTATGWVRANGVGGKLRWREVLDTLKILKPDYGNFQVQVIDFKKEF